MAYVQQQEDKIASHGGSLSNARPSQWLMAVDAKNNFLLFCFVSFPAQLRLPSDAQRKANPTHWASESQGLINTGPGSRQKEHQKLRCRE